MTMVELKRRRPTMAVLMPVWLGRGKRFRLRSVHVGCIKATPASSVVTAIILAIVAERPLGGNARGSTIRMTAPSGGLVRTRTGIVPVVALNTVQAAPTGNIMVELWSEIIIVQVVPLP